MPWSITTRGRQSAVTPRVAVTLAATLALASALTVTSAATTASAAPAAGGATSTPSARLGARPNDPPIGVTLQTLSGNPSSTVLIDGQALPNVASPENFSVVVLDQATRAVLESGTTNHSYGLGQLTEIARNWRNPDTLMIVSTAKGIVPGQRSAVQALAAAMSVPPFTDAELSRMESGLGFSMIGYPDSREGTGWSKVAPPLDGGRGADITGWLQFDPRDGRYNYVTGRFPTFSTSGAGAPARGNVIEVDGNRYSAQLPEGRSNGFQILKLTSGTLLLAGNNAVETETPAGQQNLLDTLELAARPVPANAAPPLVLVQSIGHPVPGNGGWQAASAVIEKLGGSPLAFLNLDGVHDYSLVGSTRGKEMTSEASSRLGQPGPISGVLSPGHALNFLPLIAGPAGAVNQELMTVQYQPAQAFPAISAAAMTSLGKQVRLCGSSATSCDIRERFGSDYQASWDQVAIDLNSDRVKQYPGDGGGFTRVEYDVARLELATEVSMFLQVKNYFTVLQSTLDSSSRDSRVDVKDIGDAVYDAVKPPPVSKTNVFIIGTISKVLLLGNFAGPPISAVSSGLSAAFGVAAYQAGRPADTTLTDAVQTETRKLSRQVETALEDAVDRFTTQARVIVTDYGKLTTAVDDITNQRWRLPSDPKEYVPTLRSGVRAWFMESLVPVAYPWLVRGTPPPLGPTTANALACDIYTGNWPFPDKKVGTSNPWFTMPASAQLRAIQGWGADGQPYRPTFFASKADPVMRIFNDDVVAKNSMPQSLADTMFGTGRDQLRVNLYEFLSPRHFDGLHNANQASNRCGL